MCHLKKNCRSGSKSNQNEFLTTPIPFYPLKVLVLKFSDSSETIPFYQAQNYVSFSLARISENVAFLSTPIFHTLLLNFTFFFSFFSLHCFFSVEITFPSLSKLTAKANQKAHLPSKASQSRDSGRLRGCLYTGIQLNLKFHCRVL